MAKPINEGIIDKVMQMLFKAVATGDERKAINTALGKDPSIKKDIKALAQARDRLYKKIVKTQADAERFAQLRSMK